jgi:hypothetical protein
MMLDTLRSFAESVVTSVIMWSFAALRNLYQVVTAHRLILLGLFLSLLVNVFLTSKESWGWWVERRAGRFMNRLGVGPNHIMSRAIYLKDLDEATSATMVHPLSLGTYPPGESECFSTYATLVNQTDIDAAAEDAGAAMALRSPASRLTANRLRRNRQKMGTYRHNLVVSMRMVNRIERDMIRAEWENWLGDEMLRCDKMGTKLEKMMERDSSSSGSQDGAAAGDDDHASGWEQEFATLEGLREWYERYCGSCRADMRALAASSGGSGMA